MLNRKGIARRIAHRGGYDIGAIEEVLKLFEDVTEEALRDGDGIKLGKSYKISLQELPEKRAWDGLNEKYFIRPAKLVPKVQLLKRLTDIELPVTKEEGE